MLFRYDLLAVAEEQGTNKTMENFTKEEIENKFKNGIVCSKCGYDPEKEGREKNHLTILSLMHAKEIICLSCAVK